MSIIELLHCFCVNGTDGRRNGTDYASDDCACCNGTQIVDLRGVADQYLHGFRGSPGIDQELSRRGYCSWVLEEGEVMPGTAEDAVNCELVEWVSPNVGVAAE